MMKVRVIMCDSDVGVFVGINDEYLIGVMIAE